MTSKFKYRLAREWVTIIFLVILSVPGGFVIYEFEKYNNRSQLLTTNKLNTELSKIEKELDQREKGVPASEYVQLETDKLVKIKKEISNRLIDEFLKNDETKASYLDSMALWLVFVPLFWFSIFLIRVTILSLRVVRQNKQIDKQT